jgi:hypothetical protein
MKPTAPWRHKSNVFATTLCHGLPQLLLQNSWVQASLSRYMSLIAAFVNVRGAQEQNSPDGKR